MKFFNKYTDIISMLSKAHEVSLRRESKTKQLKAEKEKLALMNADEEKRKKSEILKVLLAPIDNKLALLGSYINPKQHLHVLYT